MINKTLIYLINITINMSNKLFLKMIFFKQCNKLTIYK